MAPVYYDGLVYIGVSGAEYEIRGHVTAYDAKTGDQVWRFYTIPGPGEFGHDTWPQDNEMWKYGGGSMWQAPAIDPELGMLYIQVGNPSPDLDGTMRAGDNLFTESVVALDLKSGERKWHFQEVHHDIWDYDTVSPNVLFDVEIDGKTVKGLGQTGKTGWVYLLNRETGEPLVGIEEKPVPQMEEQHTSATQPFPVGDAFVPMECPEQDRQVPDGRHLHPLRQRAGPDLPGRQRWLGVVRSVVQPANRDDVHLRHPPAADLDVQAGQIGAGHATPGQRLHHAAGWQDLGHLHRDGRQDQHDRVAEPARSDVHRRLAGDGGWPGLRRRGQRELQRLRRGKPVTRLWQFQTGAGVNSTPITYEIDGKQYVAVASGGNFQLNFPRGDALWVFSLDGTLGPVAAPPAPSSEVAANAYATNTVDIVDFAFNPGTIIMPPGTTVTWTNTGVAAALRDVDRFGDEPGHI